MRRLSLLAAMLSVCLVAACAQESGGPFKENPKPTPYVTPSKPGLDIAALKRLRAAAATALAAHVGHGELELTWGEGASYAMAGPYPETAAAGDGLALLAARSLQAWPAGAGADSLASLAGPLRQSVMAADRGLQGPDGAAYLLLTRATAPPEVPVFGDLSRGQACPTPGSEDLRCLRRQMTDGLRAAWWEGATRSFFHIGDTTTVYRPVDAIAVGAALVVGGYSQEVPEPGALAGNIAVGDEILRKEVAQDLDDHFGLLDGLVTATAQGGKTVTDHNTRIADQAGAAEILLEAFDSSREHAYLDLARKALEPLMDEKVVLRRQASGYIAGFDLQQGGPSQDSPVDLEAGILILEAARHYDHDDGGRFNSLEETAARAVLDSAGAAQNAGADPAAGLPAALQAGRASSRSGIVTALAVVVLGEVVADLG